MTKPVAEMTGRDLLDAFRATFLPSGFDLVKRDEYYRRILSLLSSGQRADRLEKALRTLIPIAESGGTFGQVCNGCRRSSYEFEQHSNDCPMMAAREALRKEG